MSSQCSPIDLPVRGSATQLREPVLHGLRRIGRQQPPAQRLAIDDRDVRRGIAAAADTALDLAGGDLVADGDDRIQRSAARTLQGDARCQRRQARGQGCLASEVPVARMLDHRTHRHFAQALAMQAELLHQRPEGAHRHAEVADIRVGGVLAAEGDTDAAKDGDGATMQHLGPRGRPADRGRHNVGESSAASAQGQ
jgi:hypothetical protein